MFIETVAWSAATQAAVLGIALGLAWMGGQLLAGQDFPIAPAGVALAGLAIFAALAAWRESWVSHDLAYRLIATLRGRVFDVLRRSLPARTEYRRTGDLSATVVADIETLEWLYAHTAAQALSALLVLGISTAVSLLLSPLLLVWIPLLLIGAIVPWLTARRARQDGTLLAQGSAALRSELLDTLRGLRELAGSGALQQQLDRLSGRTRKLARTQLREAPRLGAERGISDAAHALAALGCILIILLDRTAIAPQDIPLAITVAVAGLGPAAQIADLLRNAGTLSAATERITGVLEHPPSIRGTGSWSSGGLVQEPGLVFDGVGFAYADGRRVLDGFSMRVSPGEIVALTGASGAGKTTAARLALRIWDPDEGSIRIDGADLRGLPDADLRRLVSAVPQSSPLLRGTIRSNITLGNPGATDAAVRQAASAAGLLDSAAGIPGGLDTPVGEHGSGLSGGQRARVAIARALLGNPRVLILDEPTASLDPDADNAVMDILRQSRDRAILLVAHRPATIAQAHRTVQLGSDGRVQDLSPLGGR